LAYAVAHEQFAVHIKFLHFLKFGGANGTITPSHYIMDSPALSRRFVHLAGNTPTKKAELLL